MLKRSKCKDARQIHPKLRGPVEAIELAVDSDTGMKNYIGQHRQV